MRYASVLSGVILYYYLYAFSDQEPAGIVTLKHIYEIAKLKQEDPPLQSKSLEEVCKMVIGIAHKLGILVVRDLSAEEYDSFLKNREVILKEKQEERLRLKQAKMTRTA